MPSTLLRYVRRSLGDDSVAELLRIAGVPYTPAFLDDVGNWIWYMEAVALFEAAAELTGDERIGRRIGEATVRQHAGTPVATLLRSLGSPQAVFEQLALAVTKFSTVTQLEPVSVTPGKVIVRGKARPGFRRHRHLCDWTSGMLSQPPVLFGLPSAEVVESSCESRGDDHCLYTITWDAARAESAADPKELVTALEAQLSGMRERLDSMYATARDLIALDDLESALARITDRAATAVRAPRYVLAVRTSPDEPMSVHHRGFGHEDDGDAAAHALLDTQADGDDPACLVVEVASGTRHYGRLMAVSPAGGFFPHERDLLAVYATYAATVLDTATALDEARRESARSSALLDLSRSVAAAGTSDEVAQRLVDAAPALFDCDRIDVFLWDEEAGALTCRAATGFTGEQREMVAELQIRPSDTPHLAHLLDAPEATPLFFDLHSTDEFVRTNLRDMGSAGLVVAPIVAHDRFYGILNVSAIDRPERLQRSTDLLDRLAGVVAQAATALDNARLIETMAHQAQHDNLTGLLGHRAFHESLDALLGAPEADGGFTLATIDIDNFKEINDRFGHPVGDEALVFVADALRASVRGDDSVFRVGGEEFCVLLPGVSADDALPLAERLREAVAAVPFLVPLRVSVGLAAWPTDARDRDRLLARADAALYAAKQAGKNCTRLVAARAA
jgi:diguanylate cyclase (GGDEF)-like protein